MIGLFSLGDKTGMVDVTRALRQIDPDLHVFGSKGTAAKLVEDGAPATDLAVLVGDPSPDHLVVTLSAIHFGILCDRNNAEHMAWLEKKKLPYIDLVWVGTYDIQSAIKTDDEEKVRQATDMGGVALLRSGAKGRRLVASDLKTMLRIVQWFREGQPHETEFRRWLAMKAEAAAMQHIMASHTFLVNESPKNGAWDLPEPAVL